jgi:hypothetical protein
VMSEMIKDEVTIGLFDECKRLQAKVEELEADAHRLAYTEEELIEASIEIERLVNAHDKERDRSIKYSARIEELEKQLKDALHLLFKSEGE